ncbi:esterase/lipase family protein [Actinomadura madurae]|uniref:esterase/lipase family protein n=1 Tax=Actinomadura madurae TaxID=1993 RepID=UPI0032B050FA
MTTFVLVHGAWHGPWAWERVVPLLSAAGARTLTPTLGAGDDHGLHDHAAAVVAALDTVRDEVVLVGHSYAGLVVREAADARPGAVGHVVMVDGWAGPDGAGMFDLAPDPFVQLARTAAETLGDGRRIPAPPPGRVRHHGPRRGRPAGRAPPPPAAPDVHRAHPPQRRRRPDPRDGRLLQAADLPLRPVRQGRRIPDDRPRRPPRRDADRPGAARPPPPGGSGTGSAKSRVMKWNSERTTSTARPRAPSTSSASAGRCCWSASC